MGKELVGFEEICLLTEFRKRKKNREDVREIPQIVQAEPSCIKLCTSLRNVEQVLLVNNGHICTLLVNILNDRDIHKDKHKQNTRSSKIDQMFLFVY